ncbi:MAG: hypothetical protein CVU20_06925 [Betaproteobacteria bacterium HGW-Betaproteobacteria-14]|jgi:hyperosmotically inducible protein|nr:MAG: hypothetical protein CVU20_06925 [Betaproteobacteria bacterium HGW-Betaproteobacteria-14]
MKTKKTVTHPLIASAALTALLLAAMPGWAASDPAMNPPAAGDPSANDALFKRLDANHDGFVSRDEASKQPRFMEAFKEADGNRDDRLSRDEFIKAHSIYDRQRAASFAKDSLVTAKVKAALVKDPVVSAIDVSVETTYGEVLLSGFVDNAQQAQRAREIAARVEGVKKVHDNIVVKG